MDERVAECLLVANVLAADGMMQESERTFLHEVMQAAGLDDDARRRVTDLDGLDDAERVIASLSLERRREVLDVLLSAVLADGKLSPHERSMIEKISRTLGL